MNSKQNTRDMLINGNVFRTMLSLSVPAILGAQTAGGAIGTATCPGNIILGCTTTDIGGSEGDVLKKTLPLSLAAAALLGLIVLAATAL